ncbi:MAG TPA: type VI secretion system tube protein Hcp [Pirellulales bacterium]
MPNSFMQIPNLPPEYTDEATKGWIDVKSCGFEQEMEIQDFADSKAKVRNAAKATLANMEVQKLLDKTSIWLMLACASGEVIPEINFSFRREDEKELYLKYELKDVLIQSLSRSLDDGEHPSETLKLNYRQIIWKFRPKKKDDTLGEWIIAGWDRQMNVKLDGRKVKG